MKTTHEVIMPALGMTQDTGVINAWLKTVGDAVAVTDVLMEVETDKTTLEVEAGFAGVIVELRADPGVDVPVGNVVAVISSDANASVLPVSEKQLPVTETEPAAESEQVAAPEPVKPSPLAKRAPVATSAIESGNILASPKAKFMADQRGIDLHRLVLQGVPPPVHAADLDRYQPPSTSVKASRLEAEVQLTIFDEFAAWATSSSEGAVTSQLVWVLFATGALRQATGLSRQESIAVQAEALLHPEQAIKVVDADLVGLLQVPGQTFEASAIQPVDLVVRNLSGTSMIEYQPEVSDTATLLSINQGRGEFYRLTLQFQQAELPLAQAIALLQGVVNRVAQPLTHLL